MPAVVFNEYFFEVSKSVGKDTEILFMLNLKAEN